VTAEEALEVATALVALVAGLVVPTVLPATLEVMLVDRRDVPLATPVEESLVAVPVPVLVPEEEAATCTPETLYTDNRSRPPQVSPVKPLH
jgi:hypothetical protein